MPPKAPAPAKATKEAAPAPAAAKDSGKAAKSAPAKAAAPAAAPPKAAATKTAPAKAAPAKTAPAKAAPTAAAPKAAAPKPAANKTTAPAKAAPAKAAAKAPAAPAKAPAKGKTAAKGEPKAAPPPKAAASRKEPKSAPPGVYIKNWGRSGVAAARALFEGFGKITAIRLRRGKYCQVWFESATSIKKACDVTRDKRGHPIKVVPAKSFPKVDRREHTKVVCIQPIYRKTTTRKQIFEQFGKAGKIVKLRTYANNIAFAYYDTSAAASKAIAEFSGTVFQNNKLTVKPSVRSVETDKKKEERRRVIIDLYRWMAQQRA